MARLYIGLVCLFLVACSSKKSSSSDGGSGGAAGDAEVTVTEATVVNLTSSNIANYTLSGTCSIDGQPVSIVFGNATPSPQPTCTNKAWSATYDLTGYDLGLTVTVVISHKAADDSSTDQVSKPLTNSFSCATGYVAVPPLEGYTDKAFCVMKYEAKEDTGGVPESVATGTPWVSIDQATAKSECNSVGTGYDLISNDEWQTLARNLELVAANWSGGTVGGAGGMNTGHTDKNPNNTLAASADDSKACEGTGQTCSDTAWNSQRRTHKLSNGLVIWDFGGNVEELVSDSYDQDSSPLDPESYISVLTDTTNPNDITLSGGLATRTRKAKAHFGTSGDYTSLSATPYGRLGQLESPAFKSSAAVSKVFLRGSSFKINSDLAGIFATSYDYNTNSAGTGVGFRCVSRP